MDGFHQMRFFSENCFETLQVFRFNKIGLLILEQLMPHQLVRYLKEDIITFRQKPSSKALEYATNMKEYELVHAALSTSGTRSQMAVNYFKGVPPMLTIVSAVRTGNITQHLQAGRQMLKLTFCILSQQFCPL